MIRPPTLATALIRCCRVDNNVLSTYYVCITNWFVQKIKMAQDELNVRKAIADIELIRRVLDQADHKTDTADLFGVTLTANITLQSLALISATFLAVFELFSGDALTELLMLGGQSPELRLAGIGIIASILAGLVILLYFVIWRAAQHSGEEFNSYVVRNFRYARLLSYLSDLMMKFGAIALVMLAGHPEWIAPLLLAFTGDYLVQGRLFTLPTRMAVILGAFCIGVGFFQFIVGLEQLLVPLIVFSVIACVSTGRLIRLRRQQNHSAA